MRRSAGAIWALAMFRDQLFQPHHAGVAEQVRENETVSVSACAKTRPAGSRRSTLVEPLEVPSIYKFGRRIHFRSPNAAAARRTQVNLDDF